MDLVFPKNCLGCGRTGRHLCDVCIENATLARPICPYCKHPSIDGATHINCSKNLGIDGLTSIWEYEGIIRKAILSLKYKYATVVGEELSEHLTCSLKRKVMPPVNFLVPIPIHWYKENSRGFNQSVEVGNEVAGSLKVKLIPDLLIKNTSTTSQAGLSRDERRLNLKGAFILNPKYPVPESVFLFDDVFTTGSTLFEAAKVLKKAGIQKVWGLTIAR